MRACDRHQVDARPEVVARVEEDVHTPAAVTSRLAAYVCSPAVGRGRDPDPIPGCMMLLVPAGKVRHHFVTIDTSSLYGIMKQMGSVGDNFEAFDAIRKC